MVSPAVARPAPAGPGGPSGPADSDDRVILNQVSFQQYETFLAALGDRSGVRLTYLRGQLEIMSPSRSHETLKTLMARLVEAWADETGTVLDGYGSMTMKDLGVERGAEPDECYAVGAVKEWPDLAIEVIWTHGGLDKLEVYRKLGVKEVWLWRGGEIGVHVLRGEAFERTKQSTVLPEFDLELLEQHLAISGSQTEIVRAFRSVLRARGISRV